MIVATEELGKWCHLFSLYKLLCFDIYDLVTNETNQGESKEFCKRQELLNRKKLNVIGVFDSTIILMPVDKDSTISYFLAYEKLEFKSSGKVNLDFYSV